MLTDAGIGAANVTIERTVEMRYLGQGYEIPVSLSKEVLTSGSEDGLRDAFRQRYEALYERSLPEIPLQALVWRLVGSGPAPRTDLRTTHVTSSTGSANKGERRVYLPELGGFRAGADLRSVPIENRRIHKRPGHRRGAGINRSHGSQLSRTYRRLPKPGYRVQLMPTQVIFSDARQNRCDTAKVDRV